MPKTLEFELSPTQLDFVLSDAHICQLTGPMGEGKTYAGAIGCIAHAQRCGTDIRAALVRDTFQNIKTSTIPDLKQYLKDWVSFHDGEKRMVIHTSPKVECDLFGIDDEASISKLQGPQYALMWLEEPAPIYERANAGLPREVFNFAIARAARQSGTIMRVQITQNPADSEHWTSILIDEPEIYAEYEDPDTGRIYQVIKKVFIIPPGENKKLAGLTRAANRAAFKGDPAKWARYVEGRTASMFEGKPAVSGYNEKLHRAPRVLPVIPGELLLFWDGWHHPVCITAQILNQFQNQLVIHDCLYEEKVGVEELIEEEINPLLASSKYKDKVLKYRCIGDPSMATPDQSSVRVVTSKKIEKYFDVRFERGPTSWPARRDPLNHILKRNLAGGRPAVLLSPSATMVHRALNGGWHFKTDNQGRIMGRDPVKNSYSNPGDALAYGVAVTFPHRGSDVQKFDQQTAASMLAAVARANSYRTNFRRPSAV